MPLKNCSDFHNLRNFLQDRHLQGIWWEVRILESHSALTNSFKSIMKSSPTLYLPGRNRQTKLFPSSSSLQTRINEACSTINQVLPPRTRLCAGRSSLKIACLLQERCTRNKVLKTMEMERKVAKKSNFATWWLWAISSVLEILYILQLQIWPSTSHHITTEKQILKKYTQMKLSNSASLLRLLLFR